MKTTVIICTKDRPDDLRAAVRSVAVQTMPPDEIIVVDAGVRTSVSDITSDFPSLPIRHVRAAPPGLTRQRNVGIRESAGDILLFIDDDVLLEPDYAERVVGVFARDVDGQIGAVLGRVTNFEAPREATSARVKGVALALILRVFLLPRPGSGRMQLSGFSTYPFRRETPAFVECLSGCAMSFRRVVAEDIRFDEHLAESPTMDDVDVAVRLRRRARIYYEPAARLRHFHSPVARDAEFSRQQHLMLNYAYLARKNWPRTLVRRAAFWWSVLGICVLHLSAGRWESWRGARAGAVAVIRQSLRRGTDRR